MARSPAICSQGTNVAGILEVSKGDEVVHGDQRDMGIPRAWSAHSLALW
jgi:hypothetical protein